MHIIKVKNKNTNYPIIIGNGVLKLLKKKIKSTCPKASKIALILDKNVPNLYKRKIKKIIKNYSVYTQEYLPKENLKTFNHVNFLVEKLIEKKFNRNDVVMAVGGGIIGDFAGFVASILKRGINFINLPTTLLAQVDSSIGGKTGINSKIGKNLIGSFYQPKLVISDLSFLKSLNKREFICGFGEVLKYSLIRDKKFFKFIKKNARIILEGKNINILKETIIRSCKNKIYFVTADEKESGKRMLLNFGHTFAHGIEGANNFSRKINHGEAVLMGMHLATKLSVRKRFCSLKTLDQIEQIYKANKLPSDLNRFFKKKELSKIGRYMVNDKKNNDNKISLILLNKIGKTTTPGNVKMSLNQINDFLKKSVNF